MKFHLIRPELQVLRATMTFLLVILASYLAMNLYVYANQRNLMFIPAQDRVTPAEAGLLGVEEVILRTDSNTDLISWFGRGREGEPTILFFHGNAGAVNHRVHRFHGLMNAGYGVFVLGYPGYGGNEGEPSEAAFQEGSMLAYEYLRSLGIEADDIVLYGESIGSGVAVQLAAKIDARGLILEAPMSSAVDVAREHYPYLLATFFLKDAFLSIERIDRIGMPLLVMHGDRDAIIPIRLGKTLFDRARDPKTFISLKGAGHNDLHRYDVDELAREFIDSL